MIKNTKQTKDKIILKRREIIEKYMSGEIPEHIVKHFDIMMPGKNNPKGILIKNKKMEFIY